MPASIVAANPTVVMPYSLSSLFAHSREYVTQENRYRNGEVQRTSFTSLSRKQWPLSKLLSNTQLVALRTFYNTQKGSLLEFYVYDPFEASPKFTYDVTGVAATGRYTVRFEGGFTQTLRLGRHAVSITLLEIS